jgi:hypothetical protein
LATGWPACSGERSAMAGNFIVTRHACERWIERVDAAATLDEARAAIRSHARAIDAAFGIGCKCVRLGNRCRLVLDLRLRQVITVYPAPSKLSRGYGIAFSATKRKSWQGEQDNG